MIVEVLTVVLIILKLLHIIDWSWFLIIGPIPLGIIIGTILKVVIRKGNW